MILTASRAQHKKEGRLRHPTFQRIFGRAEVSPWGWTSAGTPLYAILQIQLEPESAEMKHAHD